ncbi:hypothetical protein VE03_06105 [Pseudogymnoascus sp. 23342-1-I1]|nr:hypothetical protein VE03_06105 [Pseudogymnoascus sp. 23342-1-I1]
MEDGPSDIKCHKCHTVVLRAIKPEPKLWGSLPAELRLMILELVIGEKKTGWTSYAAVCKEWQFHIEKENFHRLKLRDSSLDELKTMVVRQRAHVNHIQFIIQLPEYSCQGCSKEVPWASPGQSIIGDRIFKLLSILSTWKPATGGITLELNAYSPSDSEHWFNHYYFDSDDEGSEVTTPTKDGSKANLDPAATFQDPKHGWVNGRRVKMPPRPAVEEVFQSLDIGSRIEYPRVDVVTCFMMRRQLRRSLRPADIQRIFYSFPRLERMVYEPWKAWSQYWGGQQNSQFTRLLQYGLPNTLKRLSVFEDFNKDLTTVADPESPLGHGPIEDIIRRFRLDDCANRVHQIFNLNLEELSISFMINAEDFFLEPTPTQYRDPMPTGSWERLQSLALTSQLLQPTANYIDANALLCRSGVWALQMPKLRNFVLWNGARGVAGAFIYRVHRNDASIAWRGTWSLKLTPQVIEAWRSVASTLHSKELRVEKKKLIKEDVIRSHGDAIHYLDLPCRVVEPASLWQIRKENIYG